MRGICAFAVHVSTEISCDGPLMNLIGKLCNHRPTVVPGKSDSDVILCLHLLSKTLTCTLHLSNSATR